MYLVNKICIRKDRLKFFKEFTYKVESQRAQTLLHLYI